MGKQFDMILVGDNEDVILVLKPYCKTCLRCKKEVLRTFALDREDVHEMRKLGVRMCKVECVCNNIV